MLKSKTGSPPKIKKCIRKYLKKTFGIRKKDLTDDEFCYNSYVANGIYIFEIETDTGILKFEIVNDFIEEVSFA